MMQQRRMTTAALALALVLVTGAAACGDDDDDSAADTASDNRLDIVAADYSFALSGEVHEGPMRIDFQNAGAEFHVPALFPIAAGVTEQQLIAAFESEDESAAGPLLAGDPEAFRGMPPFIDAASSASVVTNSITAGDYALVCFVGTADGQPHFSLGMVTTFTVGAAPDGAAAEALPDADGEIVINDGSYTVPDNIGDGGSFLVRNVSGQPHEITIGRLHEGATFADAEGWINQYFAASFGEGEFPAGEWPADIVGGLLDTVGADDQALIVLPKLSKGSYIVVSESEDDGVALFRTDFTVD